MMIVFYLKTTLWRVSSTQAYLNENDDLLHRSVALLLPAASSRYELTHISDKGHCDIQK